MVGEDETVRGEDDTRATALPRVDADDGGSDTVDGADDRSGIGDKKIGVVEGILERHASTLAGTAGGAHHLNGEPLEPTANRRPKTTTARRNPSGSVAPRRTVDPPY